MDEKQRAALEHYDRIVRSRRMLEELDGRTYDPAWFGEPSRTYWQDKGRLDRLLGSGERTAQDVARHVRRLDETRRIPPRAAGTFRVQAHREDVITRVELVAWGIAGAIFGFALGAFLWAPV